MLLSLLTARVLAVIILPVLGGRFAAGFLAGMLFALGFVIAGLLLLAKRAGRRGGDNLRPPELPGTEQVWDYVLSARSLEGDFHDFASARGREVLVLNFWATWCPPCVAELPSLERLAAKVRASPCVSSASRPSRRSRSAVSCRSEASSSLSWSWTASHQDLTHRSIPVTFIIDKQGAPAMRHRGAARWDADTIVAYVGELARRPAGTAE